jgi:hypothetical protein
MKMIEEATEYSEFLYIQGRKSKGYYFQNIRKRCIDTTAIY